MCRFCLPIIPRRYESHFEYIVYLDSSTTDAVGPSSSSKTPSCKKQGMLTRGGNKGSSSTALAPFGGGGGCEQHSRFDAVVRKSLAKLVAPAQTKLLRSFVGGNVLELPLTTSVVSSDGKVHTLLAASCAPVCK